MRTSRDARAMRQGRCSRCCRHRMQAYPLPVHQLRFRERFRFPPSYAFLRLADKGAGCPALDALSVCTGRGSSSNNFPWSGSGNTGWQFRHWRAFARSCTNAIRCFPHLSHVYGYTCRHFLPRRFAISLHRAQPSHQEHFRRPRELRGAHRLHLHFQRHTRSPQLVHTFPSVRQSQPKEYRIGALQHLDRMPSACRIARIIVPSAARHRARGSAPLSRTSHPARPTG